MKFITLNDTTKSSTAQLHTNQLLPKQYYFSNSSSLFAKLFAATITAIGLTSCVSIPPIEEVASSKVMEPITAPKWSSDMSFKSIDLITDEPTGYDIIEVLDNGNIRAVSKRTVRGKNCTWVNGPDWFSPSRSWENCGTGEWSSGTQNVNISGDNLWPLQAGKKAQYRRTSISSAGTKGTPEVRKCEVSGPVIVSLRNGNYEAMKVTCKTKRWDNTTDTRVWYWNQDHLEIKYRRSNSQKGIIHDTERVFDL